MTQRYKRIPGAVLCVCALLATACASAPTLVTKPAAVPEGVNLSGYWRARATSGAARLPGQKARSEPIIRSSRASRHQQHRPTGSPVEIFLEFGDVLKISQTAYGLFISYDRSVVEEYTFGENRDIEIGPIEARRVSGWDGRVFSVETLDKRGNTLFESWRLQDSDTTLLRSIAIKRGDKTLFFTEERFDRLRKSGDDSSGNLAGR